MSNENNIMISVDSGTYQRLIEAEAKLKIAVTMLLSSARLNYNKNGLSFDDDIIDTALKSIAPNAYSIKLQTEKEAE